MCLIIHAKPGQVVEPVSIHDSLMYNQDGIGVSVLDRGKVETVRGVCEKVAIELMSCKSVERLYHARLATHGGDCPSLIHPFNLPYGAVLMHNGILPRPFGDAPKGHSDTSYFVHWANRNLQGRWWRDKTTCEAVSSIIGYGNKFAIMDSSGVVLINEHLGIRDVDGVWFSNDNYCEVNSPKSKYSRRNSHVLVPSGYEKYVMGHDDFADDFDDGEDEYEVYLCDCGAEVMTDTRCNNCGMMAKSYFFDEEDKAALFGSKK